MYEKIRCLLFAVIAIMSFSGPANAHFVGEHNMGIVEGVTHLFTHPAHVLILVPALAVLWLGISIRKWRRR